MHLVPGWQYLTYWNFFRQAGVDETSGQVVVRVQTSRVRLVAGSFVLFVRCQLPPHDVAICVQGIVRLSIHVQDAGDEEDEDWDEDATRSLRQHGDFEKNCWQGTMSQDTTVAVSPGKQRRRCPWVVSTSKGGKVWHWKETRNFGGR